MATVSVSLPADGQTADAADYNVPINTIVAEINGGLDSDNIEAGGVTPNSLQSGTGTSWAWQSFTPTMTNWTIGSGGSAVTTGLYTQIGKTVHFRIRTILGSSGQSVGSGVSFSLPVTSAATGYAAGALIGQARVVSAGIGYFGWVNWLTTGTASVLLGASSSTYVNDISLASNIPGVFVAGDSLTITGTYEAA